MVNWDAEYVVSRSLTLEVTRAGKLVAAISLSRSPYELDAEAVPVLLAFASGTTPRAAFQRLQEEWELEWDDFGQFVATMLDDGVLVPAGGEPAALIASGFGVVAQHVGMLRDTARVMAYRAAIEKHAPGQRVVEIGCGTGILSLFAARAGARKVIAIEESQVSETAAAMFEANGCRGIIDLEVANSRNVELDEPADLLIHELLGVDPFDENLLPVLLDARRRLLRPGGRMLPRRLEICCLGIEGTEDPQYDAALGVARARELSGLHGLDFSPVIQAVEAASSRPRRTRTWLGDKGFDRRILSEELRLLDLDLEAGDLEIVGRPAASASLRITAEGTLVGVVLFFRAHLDEEIRLTTSPFAPLTHWGWDVRFFSRRLPVRPGDEVPLAVEIESTFGNQRMNIDLGF
jgi:protein arginine N-methyltransferase 1